MTSLARHLTRIALLASLTFGSGTTLSAAGFSLFSRPTRNVFIVTDVTPAGKKLVPPTKGNPVYCGAMSFGCDFGTVPGDKIPDSKAMLDLIVKILAEQGYQGNDETHPPSLMLTFQWGWRRGNLAGNLAYLGGDKLDLMWETENYPWINSNVLLRNMRSATATRVMEISEDDLYAITICAFDFESASNGSKAVMLWQTRIAVPTTGFTMAEALPRIIEIAGPNIGRETLKPIVAKPDREGTVEYGELKEIGVEEEADAAPTTP